MFVSLQGFPGPQGLEGASGRKGEHVSESEKTTLSYVLFLHYFFVFSYMNLYYRAQLGLLGSLDHWAFQESRGNKALKGHREREDQVAKRSISSINYDFFIIILKSVQ